ncbi:MAG: hypothetical protein Q7S79_00550 [bacterium]|nr:hypothetical protein [bacterium]
MKQERAANFCINFKWDGHVFDIEKDAFWARLEAEGFDDQQCLILNTKLSPEDLARLKEGMYLEWWFGHKKGEPENSEDKLILLTPKPFTAEDIARAEKWADRMSKLVQEV